jgi:hypothetical protein
VRAGRDRLLILKFGRRAAELQGSKISTGVEIPVEESGWPRNGERHDVPTRGSQQSKVGRPACAGNPPDYILPKASSSRGIYRAYLAGCKAGFGTRYPDKSPARREYENAKWQTLPAARLCKVIQRSP